MNRARQLLLFTAKSVTDDRKRKFVVTHQLAMFNRWVFRFNFFTGRGFSVNLYCPLNVNNKSCSLQAPIKFLLSVRKKFMLKLCMCVFWVCCHLLSLQRELNKVRLTLSSGALLLSPDLLSHMIKNTDDHSPSCTGVTQEHTINPLMIPHRGSIYHFL